MSGQDAKQPSSSTSSNKRRGKKVTVKYGAITSARFFSLAHYDHTSKKILLNIDACKLALQEAERDREAFLERFEKARELEKGRSEELNKAKAEAVEAQAKAAEAEAKAQKLSQEVKDLKARARRSTTEKSSSPKKRASKANGGGVSMETDETTEV